MSLGSFDTTGRHLLGKFRSAFICQAVLFGTCVCNAGVQEVGFVGMIWVI